MVIEIKNLTKKYPVKSPFGKIKGYVHALNGINLTINDGEILALAGESGCGKSTLGRCILLLEEPTSGEILFDGDNIFKKCGKEIKAFRKQSQMIFQNPYSSLNPVMTIRQILEEPLIIHGEKDKKERERKIFEICDMTGISKDSLKRYPHEFSGGQRQRVAIASAMILRPKFIVADEPVSALDVSIRAQIINLLKDLKRELGLTMLFISHDLSVVKSICDRVAVMYCGEIVEFGTNSDIFENALHPYTKTLLDAVPVISEHKKTLKIFPEGELPSPLNLPEGCKFAGRCKNAVERCLKASGKKISDTHYVNCLMYAGL